MTDYPDAALVANLRKNVAEAKVAGVVAVEGYLWGAEMGPLLGYSEGGFDVVLLSDLLFNHSEHEKLVASVKGTLKRSEVSRALVFFTPHRPWLYEKDLDFFRLVAEHGFEVEKLFEKLLDAPMFEEDRGVGSKVPAGRGGRANEAVGSRSEKDGVWVRAPLESGGVGEIDTKSPHICIGQVRIFRHFCGAIDAQKARFPLVSISQHIMSA